jgi:hypothetical protein
MKTDRAFAPEKVLLLVARSFTTSRSSITMVIAENYGHRQGLKSRIRNQFIQLPHGIRHTPGGFAALSAPVADGVTSAARDHTDANSLCDQTGKADGSGSASA